ncbi:MAG: OmpA family protein [Bacteroidales bacterium]|nr:OmpA family protein [Bacteroidales bacterium]MDD4001595.1 OmpA family protein [Bacteroidales bacterium]MDD4528273.1 OmpA family protein [Bacteroidales bacterium]MDD4829237.1 OmpA family protein [Bacteroidales bacterium]
MLSRKNKIKIPIIVIITLLSLNSSKTMAQMDGNLIYNPSFEEYYTCPQKIEPYGYMSQAVAWWQPTGGSADYYNKCGSKQCNVPKNKLGIQMPRTGVGMVGIYTSKTTYREYIQTEFKEHLEEGEKYKLTFYVSLSEYSSGAIATIGALFTNDRIEEKTREMLTQKITTNYDNGISQSISTYLKPQIVNPYNNPIVDTEKWTKIEGEYIALGGEKFLTIGNFYPSPQSNLVDLAYLTYLLPGAYYYIDDISLVCLSCKEKQVLQNEITITKTKDEKQFEVGQVVVMENIFFEFDKSIILPQSFVELHNLISLLSKYPTMKIELSGHTDNKGSDRYNQNLSHSRVKAVYDYLVSQGISPKRLQYSSYGATQPIADNKTDQGRSKNRRVEFKILEL